MGNCDNVGFFGNYCRINVLSVSTLLPVAIFKSFEICSKTSCQVSAVRTVGPVD